MTKLLLKSRITKFGDLPKAFLQIVRRLRNEQASNHLQQKIKYVANNALSFPKSEVERIEEVREENVLNIMTNFLGLIGTTGVLPIHYSEQILKQFKNKQRALYDFYNIFHHRLIEHYYAAWSEQNPIVDYEQIHFTKQASSNISGYLCHLLGLPEQPQHEMLRHHSFFARPERSPDKLKNILQDKLNMQVIIQNAPHYSESLLENGQATFLSKQADKAQHNALGQSWILGEKVRMDHAYFTVTLLPDHYEDYAKLIGDKKRLQEIKALISHYAGNGHKFAVIVDLESDKRQPMRLFKDSAKAAHPDSEYYRSAPVSGSSPRLGQTSFL